ncbi:MAG: class II histone deacetylase [Thermomicrobiales bacterium]|nr:class II histone deacetylase [Thermomicrobiales bacterium]
MADARRVGLVFDDRYLTHNTGLGLFGEQTPYPYAEPIPHVSKPALVGRAKHLMDLYGVTDQMVRIEPLVASDEQLLTYHTPEHLARVKALSDGLGGDSGQGAPMGQGGDRVARLAAGGTIAAVNAVLQGDVDTAYALVRPPGHHAMADQGMGFCVYSNAVLAARFAQQQHGVAKVLILDWDVHHGNGTQAAFWSDPSVLFISLHQDDLYPVGWGAVDQVGVDDGEGFTVNVPLPAGSGNAAYAAAFAALVIPIATQFDPDVVIVSAGQDASVFDPLARMSITTAGYRAMCEAMLAIADVCCGGKLVVTQEGGYAAEYAPYCSATIGQTLVGVADEAQRVPEPYGERAVKQPASNVVGLDAEQAIERARQVQAKYWRV